MNMKHLKKAAAVSLAIIMLALVYILQMKRTYHKLRTQAAYIDHLYNAVPELSLIHI